MQLTCARCAALDLALDLDLALALDLDLALDLALDLPRPAVSCRNSRRHVRTRRAANTSLSYYHTWGHNNYSLVYYGLASVNCVVYVVHVGNHGRELLVAHVPDRRACGLLPVIVLLFFHIFPRFILFFISLFHTPSSV